MGIMGIRNTLNYDRTFGKHNLSLLAGYSARKTKVTAFMVKMEICPSSLKQCRAM